MSKNRKFKTQKSKTDRKDFWQKNNVRSDFISSFNYSRNTNLTHSFGGSSLCSTNFILLFHTSNQKYVMMLRSKMIFKEITF